MLVRIVKLLINNQISHFTFICTEFQQPSVFYNRFKIIHLRDDCMLQYIRRVEKIAEENFRFSILVQSCVLMKQKYNIIDPKNENKSLFVIRSYRLLFRAHLKYS